MARAVRFAKRAVGQLTALYAWIETASGVARAETFTSRIVAFCEGLQLYPERGTRRDDLRPGIRIIGFRRLVTIAITIADAIVVLGIFYGGRDYEAELRSGYDD